MKFENKIVTNRKSPANEQAYIEAYKKMNPSASKHDNYDISCVTSKNGVKGHALMKDSSNRSKDNNYHIGKDFIADKDLRKKL